MTWSFDDKLPIYLQIIRILKSDLEKPAHLGPLCHRR